ncbi:hypothetical protein ACMZ4X_03349 [Achromobacter marplatensis]
MRQPHVLTGGGQQAIGLAQARRHFVCQCLFVNKARRAGAVARRLKTLQRHQWLFPQAGQFRVDQLQLAAKGGWVQSAPFHKAGAVGQQCRDGGVGVGRRTWSARRCQRQVQVAIRRIDVADHGRLQRGGARQAVDRRRVVVEIKGRHAVVQPDPESGGFRMGSTRLFRRRLVAHIQGRAQQPAGEPVLRLEQQFNVYVLDQASQRQAAFDFLFDQAQLLAHEKQVGHDVVAGVARHAQVARRAAQRHGGVGMAQRHAQGLRPGADLVHRDQRGDAFGLETVVLGQRHARQSV